MTEVSVIMPAYNAGNFISESIESVINQTFTNWELIIVDDGSTDNTAKVVNEYVIKDKRIKYFYQKNGKQGKARNLAISKSQGRYLAFLDADDLMLPLRLEAQLESTRLTGADLIFSDAYIFENYPFNGRESQFNIISKCYKGKEGIISFLEINRIPILTVLVKKDCVLKVNGFSEIPELQNAEDYHLWLKLLLADFKLCGTSNIVGAYRIHASSVSDGDGLNRCEVLFLLKDLISNSSDLSKRFKESFLARKKEYIASIKDKEPYFFLILSKKYLRLFSGSKFHFKVLFYLERFFGRKSALSYLYFTTII